ncbi:MAG: hypothetical protein COB53_00845 [Elusimicrobia bacterium]|nr:MAG: hypothetical protein COB53_00845 [Elusimicrobiota bacterium]
MDSLLYIWTFFAASASFFWSRQALKRLDQHADAIRELRGDKPAQPASSPQVPPAAPKKGLPMKAKPALAAPKPEPASKKDIPNVEPAFEWPLSWEDFTAGQVFSWVGGFALFLGAAFFVKYSIEHDLITPLMRITMGAGVGIAAIIAGLRLEWGGEKAILVTAHTLCAAGIGILYADIFAAHAKFGFVTMGVAAVLMAATTLAAFLLSERMNSRYIAVIALVSGFLTPPLLSMGNDHAFLLFSYIAVLNLGIFATVIRKRWGFLAVMAAAGTALTQWSWMLRYFNDGNTLLAAGIFAFFPLLFVAAREISVLRGVEEDDLDSAAGAMPFVAFPFAALALFVQTAPGHPWIIFSLLMFCGVLVAALALRKEGFRVYHGTAGVLTAILLGLWMGDSMNEATLTAGLVFSSVFALLHAAFPWILEQMEPDAKPFEFSGYLPVVMLALIGVPVLRGFGDATGLWFAVLLIDAAAITAAVTLGMTRLCTFVLLGSMGLLGMSVDVLPIGEFYVVLGVFSAGFFALGTRLQGEKPASGAASLAALSSLTPFVLIAIAVVRVPGAIHLPFLFTSLVVAMNVFLIRRLGNDDAAWGLLGGIWIVCTAWGAPARSMTDYAQVLPWFGILFGSVATIPFLDPEVPKERSPVWTVAALSGPAMFLPIHAAVSASLGNSLIGVLPALFAVLYAAACYQIVGEDELTDPTHKTRIAWFGGVTLFFVSLIVPLQFDKEWITLAWAFEGAALLVLYRKLPHEGLKLWAGGLLAVAFVRLAANPAVFFYHSRAGLPVFNWFLGVYGAVIASFFAAARLWSPKEEEWAGCPVTAALEAGGTILAFLLLNIEIADFFSTGATILFFAGGNLAMDLSYSLGWGAFGITLLVIGLFRNSRGARLGSVLLLSVTIGKLFLHDIWLLEQLYRVASLIGLSAVLIAASFLYQRFSPDLEESLS